ncbi:hypothetical protein J3R82DRAFT_3614 [Butyriboletus roseoflavus]|nr:hypothetical protein J3R82DRAFT_3614 [Butyriboletus roseoflavus]
MPVDMSNPAVQDFLSLVRLQVLTPLSLLVNIATVLVCSVIVKPSIVGIIRLYPASISPHPAWLSVYVILIYLFQVGYCLLLALTRNPDTKKTLVKAVGHSLVLANWAMALWAVTWVKPSLGVCAGVPDSSRRSCACFSSRLSCSVSSSSCSCIPTSPSSCIMLRLIRRPFDMALIHAPLRFFMILPLSLMFPYSLFITLGLSYAPEHPEDYVRHPWPGFAVVMALNLVGLAVILFRRDVIWAIAATWICIGIWTASPKPAPVFISVLLFTVLHPARVDISARVRSALTSTRSHRVASRRR